VKRKIINGHPFVELSSRHFDESEMVFRSRNFLAEMWSRRSVRDFSSKPVPIEVIKNILETASSAPSGAHKQPWTFCVIQDAEIKKQIRIAAEKEEKESYDGRMSEEWLQDLAPLQTDWQKPFLETAPYLIVVFKKVFDILPNGSKGTNYYVAESVGIACGFLLASIHNAGLVALTHTPSPMNFLSKILNRPENERPFLLIPVGYPSEAALVPELQRKSLEEISLFF
jgi:iodotyrosine deiodinase